MKFPESYRFRPTNPNLAHFATNPSDPYGLFLIPGRDAKGRALFVQASAGRAADPDSPLAGDPWDHVSVSLWQDKRGKCPSWDEMCLIKDLFWEPEEEAIQIHPPASQHVSNHSGCLHLWRHATDPMSLPHSHLVGVKGIENANLHPEKIPALEAAAQATYESAIAGSPPES